MKYTVTIVETSKALIDVEAETFEEALHKAEQEYWKNPAEYVLEPYETEFK